MSMLDRVREDLRNFTLYTAGDSDDTCIRLHANESPYRAEHDESARGEHRYPRGRDTALIERLANQYDVDPDQLLVTRGSDDGIDLLVRTFCTAGEDAIACTTPGFGMYRALARLQGCEAQEFSLTQDNDFDLDIEDYLGLTTPATKLLFLCSPNNPSGRSVPLDDIALACARLANRTMVVVDEAYGEFSAAPSAATLLTQFDNLVVLRTLSKAYGLAAARVGAVLGHPEIIAVLDRLLTPFPLPSTSVQAAMRQTNPALRGALLQQWQSLVSEREKMLRALPAIACIEKVWPSDANFLLTRTIRPAALVDHCRGLGFLVRHIAGVDSTYVRITIGRPEQNAGLLDALEQFGT